MLVCVIGGLQTRSGGGGGDDDDALRASVVRFESGQVNCEPLSCNRTHTEILLQPGSLKCLEANWQQDCE